MSADKRDELVAEWLRELGALVADLPVVQRRELLRDLESHIGSELEERPEAGETELLEILERLGEPRAIAAAAYEEAGLGQTEGRAFAAAVLTAAAPERYSGRAVVITPAPPVLHPRPEAYVPPAAAPQAPPPSDKPGRRGPSAPRPGAARGWARPSGFHAMLPPAPPPPVPPRQATPWVVAAVAGGIFLVVVVLVGCFGGLMLANGSSVEPASVVPAAPMVSAEVGPGPADAPVAPDAATTVDPLDAEPTEDAATVTPTPDEPEPAATE